ncbi:hypothetical protein [Halorussus lipolyticus]|uniref:hypothetical protein n=1 Tax=Halorussus lipolyticus TaxID=3034024 RepID=UPI0023E8DF9F|nr:hypothetical protein [Halorussus sp. DT80]
MSRQTWSVVARLVAFAGAGGVAVGTWLPWLMVRPGYQGPVPAIHLAGMETGIAGLDWLALTAAAVALLGVLPVELMPVSVPLLGGARAAVVTTVAGGFVAVLTVYYLLSSGFLGTFVPAAGFYLTALGGVHLSMGGALRLYAIGG